MTDDIEAPHGRDANGHPVAPFGLKVDGNPRKSRRGAIRGEYRRGGGGTPAKSARSTGRAPLSAAAQQATDVRRKSMLMAFTDQLIVTPMVTLSVSPIIKKRIGNRQADALSGDAVILHHYAPDLADGLIMLSQSKPGLLSWLDTVEENAPYLMLAQVGIQITKALISNHMNPDERLANSGRMLGQLVTSQLAQEIEQQYAAAQQEHAEFLNRENNTEPADDSEAA